MDFGVLSPEVNSGRMYAGPGSGPMLAAAGAWERLAGELGSAADGYESVVAELTGEGWLGPAAEAMAAAAGPFAGWLGAVAVQAGQAAAQARAAAGAFEEAYAAVVPPTVIAANRSRLAALVAGNVLGHNSAAIAAAEAEYGQMWVQDAAAMYGYAGRSAAAAAVAPFSEPPPVTNAAGSGVQAAAVAHAAASSGHSQLSQLLAAIPHALHGVGPSGSPALPIDPVAPFQSVTQAPTPTQLISYLEMTARAILPANDANVTILDGQVQYARNLNIAADIFKAAPPSLGAGLSSATGAAATGSTGLSGAGPAVSAGVGNAGTVGKLAVPSAWAEAAPEVQMTAAALPGTSAMAAPAAAAADGSSELFADMALAGLAGRAIAGNAPRNRKPSADRGRLERLADELTGTREVQHWHTNRNRRKGLLNELSQQPGVHTVHFDPDDQGQPEPGPQPGRG